MKEETLLPDLDTRLRLIEDRAAIGQVLLDYYTAVDSLADLDGLVACFTPDAAFDLTGLGLAKLVGHDAIRHFFAGVFADMTHHAHHVSNLRVLRLDGDVATAHGYVIGRAVGRDGLTVLVSCKYDVELVRTDTGWKITRFDETALMPLDGAVAELHAGH